MESSTALTLSNFSIFLPKPDLSSNTSSLLFMPGKQRISKNTPKCGKMYVPGFGEASPEAKAAKHLQDFFTYVAVRIVNAQLESYNTEGHQDLMEFMETHPLNDGDKFCAELMRVSSRHKTLALRILEVRSAYSKRDFEWDNLKRLAAQMVDERNTKLMRDYVLETLSNETDNDK